MGSAGRPPGFLAVLRGAEYRALWAADVVSVLGDQLSRVSVSLLVFAATHSAVATALVYALTFLPTLLGGAVLSGLADHLPRKAVMVVTDVLRAGLFVVMALPHLSLVVVAVLLVVAVMLGSPFRAAQTATLPDVLPGELYPVGLALRSISLQSAQLAGYAAGGLIAGLAGPRTGLLVDAATFAGSAALIGARVRARPVPAREREHESVLRHYLAGVHGGFTLIGRSPRLRIMVGLACMSGFYVVPEGLAAPYAAALGSATLVVGLLMAADPAGSAVGAWLLVRFVRPAAQERTMALLAVAPGIALAFCALRPGLVVTLALWVLSGAFSAFQIPASVTFVRALPDARRGQALGLVTSAMLAAQGIGVLLAGVLASAVDPETAVATAGVAGSLAALALAWRWRIARVADPDPAAVGTDPTEPVGSPGSVGSGGSGASAVDGAGSRLAPGPVVVDD